MAPLQFFSGTYLTPRVAATLVWLLAVGASVVWFSKYQTTSGETGFIHINWPAESSLHRNQRGPTIVLFLHPKCPCSTASVRQLFEFVSDARSVEVLTVLVLPEGTDESFAQGTLMNLLEQEYQRRPILDNYGKEAALFGAQTSGQAFAYSRDGRLLFSGGLTPTRGRTGYSPSISALHKSLQGLLSEAPRCPVFGCPLQSPPQLAEKL